MPLWLLLIVLGIIAIVLAKYVISEAPFNNWTYAVGVICVAVGVILMLYSLIIGGALHA